jgi:cell division initiation protein
MRLTPLDIQQKQFGKSFRGYSPVEVQAFLDAVAAELEERVKENLALAEELKRREARLAEVDGREKALHDALVAAQKVADDMRQVAKKEAEQVVAEAELRADAILADANARLVRLRGDLDELRRQRAAFEARLEGLLETHRKLLEATRGEELRELGKLALVDPGKAG